MAGAHHNEKLVQYEPLSAPDHKEKGFKFAGDPIIVDAMARWRKAPFGVYEDFLREAYLREARLQDALVVNLGTGDPLTDEEVRVTDPYCLAVMYEDGNFSKVWEEPRMDYSKLMKSERSRARSAQSIQPSPENIINEFRFHGTPCKSCGGTLRYIKLGNCISCDGVRAKRHREKQSLAATTV
jgi:hypothetical protein